MAGPLHESTLGQALQSRRVGGFHLLIVQHDARTQLRPHSHVHPSLCCVLDGGFHEWMGGACYRVGPASLLIEPAGVDHRSRFGARPTRSLILEVIDRELAGHLTAHGSPLHTPALMRSPELARIGERLERELLIDDRATNLAVEGLALELTALASRLIQSDRHLPPVWLERVAERLRELIFDDVDSERLAHEAGVHPVHLARSFRRYFGESPSERLRSLRLDWCAQRLSNGDESIAEVAERARFCDPSHMARHFRQRFGYSPRQYRVRHRSPHDAPGAGDQRS